MEDNQQHIDKLFRERLGSYTEVPPPAVWNAIGQKMGTGAAPGVSFFTGIWKWLLPVVAGLTITGILYYQHKTSKQPDKKATQRTHVQPVPMVQLPDTLNYTSAKVPQTTGHPAHDQEQALPMIASTHQPAPTKQSASFQPSNQPTPTTTRKYGTSTAGRSYHTSRQQRAMTGVGTATVNHSGNIAVTTDTLNHGNSTHNTAQSSNSGAPAATGSPITAGKASISKQQQRRTSARTRATAASRTGTVQVAIGTQQEQEVTTDNTMQPSSDDTHNAMDKPVVVRKAAKRQQRRTSSRIAIASRTGTVPIAANTQQDREAIAENIVQPSNGDTHNATDKPIASSKTPIAKQQQRRASARTRAATVSRTGTIPATTNTQQDHGATAENTIQPSNDDVHNATDKPIVSSKTSIAKQQQRRASARNSAATANRSSILPARSLDKNEHALQPADDHTAAGTASKAQQQPSIPRTVAGRPRTTTATIVSSHKGDAETKQSRELFPLTITGNRGATTGDLSKLLLRSSAMPMPANDPDNNLSQPAGKYRSWKHPFTWSGGVQAGYELGPADNKVNKWITGLFLQRSLGGKWLLSVSPAYKFGNLQGGGVQDKVTNYYRITSTQLDSNRLDTFPNPLYTYRYTQRYDSIIIKKQFNKKAWEISIPVTISYTVLPHLVLYGGPVFSWNNKINVTRDQQTYGITYKDSIIKSSASYSPAYFNNKVTHTGQPIDSTVNEDPAAGSGQFKIGYILGLSYTIDHLVIQLGVQQNLSGYKNIPDAGLRSIYKQPYFHFTIGYRLFNHR